MSSEKAKEQNQFGKDFLTYVCYMSDVNGGFFEVPRLGQIHLLIAGRIVFEDTAFEPPSTIVYSGNGFTRGEFKNAIKNGRKVKEVNLCIDKDNDTWSFILRAENFDIVGLRIALKQDRSDDLESRLYTRILSIEKLHVIIDELYYHFLIEISREDWKRAGYKKFQRWLNSK